MEKIKIVVDAMGGDLAPLNDVSGAIIAAEDKTVKYLTLFLSERKN